MWKTPSNWLFWRRVQLHVREQCQKWLEILDGMINSAGNIISGDGTPAVAAMFERANRPA